MWAMRRVLPRIVGGTRPGSKASVEVWRKGFGSYPTYDNGGGAAPSVPGAYPPAGWTRTTDAGVGRPSFASAPSASIIGAAFTSALSAIAAR